MNMSKLAKLLYDMGTVFDGFKGTLDATEDFLRSGDTNGLATIPNRDLMLDLRECSLRALNYDYQGKPFDHSLLQYINAGITRTASLWPGRIRDDQHIAVNTVYGVRYAPSIPDVESLDEMMKSCDENVEENPMGTASRLFVELAKAQPFWDGNRRTALLAANGMLSKHGFTDQYFTVPSDERSVEFNRLLSDYYLDRNNDIISWLSNVNKDLSSQQLEPNNDKKSFPLGGIHVRSHYRKGIHVHSYNRNVSHKQ